MDALMYWSGVAVWAVVALHLMAFAYESAKGAVIACDWLWWRVSMCRAHGIDIRWHMFPVTFAKRWHDFTLSGASEHHWYGEHGWWNGFRDWGIHPKTPN